MTDNISKPPHYRKGKIEVIEVIEGLDLPYHLGNAVKYIGRCRYKGTEIEDLKKAIWYLERYIKLREGKR